MMKRVMIYDAAGDNYKPEHMAEYVQVRGNLLVNFAHIRHVVQEVHIGKGP